MITEEEESAGLLRPLAIGLCIWEVIIWFLTIVQGPTDWYIVTLIAHVVRLYFDFQLLTNVAMIADKYNCEQRDSILGLRTAAVILNVLLALPFPVDGGWYLIPIGIAIITLIVLIWLCVTLFSLRKTILTKEIP